MGNLSDIVNTYETSGTGGLKPAAELHVVGSALEETEAIAAERQIAEEQARKEYSELAQFAPEAFAVHEQDGTDGVPVVADQQAVVDEAVANAAAAIADADPSPAAAFSPEVPNEAIVAPPADENPADVVQHTVYDETTGVGSTDENADVAEANETTDIEQAHEDVITEDGGPGPVETAPLLVDGEVPADQAPDSAEDAPTEPEPEPAPVFEPRRGRGRHPGWPAGVGAVCR
jgi:hypothetical protein